MNYLYRHPEKVETLIKELQKEDHTASFLEVLKTHHHDTFAHSIRVAKLSIDLALENNLPIKVVRVIGHAALLHDFGKTKIDRKILSKSEPLNWWEKLIMKWHPQLGLSELRGVVSQEIRVIIASHHRPIDAMTEIVSAADMYDALSSPRAYKDGFDLEKVEAIMLEQFSGKKILIDQLTKIPRGF
ncbi:MAG: hypothetical protein A2758_00690 [Candidatus Zambryskibacteria bacterium RIFCSPHIGHO2_01_FULL_49_18]|uniref:Uncharacterized protein n=2 Tax=Candidatus Zambryskiibacteriota TaxID=1817925 RepID=A0A1G2T2X4_9BACT|nr:MAG: hypothetical protein A2758_00690 [Candidatus Zambryskibacteria bacterium RIFCSPHIGHO2_01_FULL_49_18]OHB05940.1 MAG: hypothetical protein A3A26_03275 [Candidatus Zambryskibacteria bacterium RIFCSPLOWO2_01_FULL_47_14]